jgi:uncharacterized delta-60 repeat protein
MQSDGKMLALYDTHLNNGNGFTDVVVRYNPDGSLDDGGPNDTTPGDSFGVGGFLKMNWNDANNNYGAAYALVLQTVGTEEKILLAGASNSQLRIDRYNANGTPDTTFDGDGTARFNVGYALAMTVQPDGRILTMGDVGALARINSDGTLDTSFGSGGAVQLSGVRGYSLAVQASGKILVGGTAANKGKNALCVLRFNANGTPDDGGRSDSTPGDAFGTSGKTLIDFISGGSWGGDSRNDWLKLDADGKILFSAIASAKNSSNGQFAMARLTANGAFDATFSGDGRATVDLTLSNDSPRSFEIQANGQIVMTGMANTSTSSSSNLGMTRLNPDGSLDRSFGTNGILIKNFSNGPEWNHAGRIQFDPGCGCEKIVTVGSAEIDGIDYSVAARFLLQ